MTTEQKLDDLAKFGAALIESQDLDPIYPILSHFYAAQGWEPQSREALWFTALYLTYYDITSALRAFRMVPDSLALPLRESVITECLNALPCATERRGMRGGHAWKFLYGYVNAFRAHSQEQRRFLQQGMKAFDSRKNFERFWLVAQSVPGVGRWAAFKWADLLINVHEFPMSFPDMRLQHCSGPREGLELLFSMKLEGEPPPLLNKIGRYAQDALKERGVETTWDTLETMLCNYKSLAKGKYYVGHDIDENLHALHKVEKIVDVTRFWDARQAVIPDAYRGEFCGWSGVDAERKKVYYDTGNIITRQPFKRG